MSLVSLRSWPWFKYTVPDQRPAEFWNSEQSGSTRHMTPFAGIERRTGGLNTLNFSLSTPSDGAYSLQSLGLWLAVEGGHQPRFTAQ